MGRTSNNNKNANYESVVCFAQYAFFGTSDFRFMIISILYLLTSCFITCILFHQSPALILLYHVYSLLDVTCYISLFPVCMYSQYDFLGMFMIQIYRYTCAYARHLAFAWSLAGEFWLLWILMSRSQSLQCVDSPSCWPERRSDSVDLRQTVQSPILPGPSARL